MREFEAKEIKFDSEGWPLCPFCGDRLEFYETEGHDEPSGLWDVPPSYVIEYYIYRCRECGEYIKTEKQL